MRRVTSVLLTGALTLMLVNPAAASQSASGQVWCGWSENPFVHSYSIGLTEHFSPGGWNYGNYQNDVWTARRTYSGHGTGGGSWQAEVIGEGSLDPGSTYGGCDY